MKLPEKLKKITFDNDDIFAERINQIISYLEAKEQEENYAKTFATSVADMLEFYKPKETELSMRDITHPIVEDKLEVLRENIENERKYCKDNEGRWWAYK